MTKFTMATAALVPLGLVLAAAGQARNLGIQGQKAPSWGVTEWITVPWLFYGDGSQSCTQKCDGIQRFSDEVISRL